MVGLDGKPDGDDRGDLGAHVWSSEPPDLAGLLEDRTERRGLSGVVQETHRILS
jgi:hypothetical protein